MNSKAMLFFTGIVFVLTLFVLMFHHKLTNTGLMVDCSWWIVTSPLWIATILISLYALIRFYKWKRK